MTQPTSYNKTTNFTAFSTANPTTPHQGTSLDGEFNNIETTLDETLVNLALIQRDDGKIKNQSVHKDAFDSTALALMGGSWTPRGDWVTATSYSVSDCVDSGGLFYVCAELHTSGVFAADLAAGKWMALGASASDVVFTPAGTIAATTAQAAIEEVATDAAAALASAVATSDAALAAHLADAADAHAASAITNTPAGNIIATTVQAALNELDTEKVALTGNNTLSGDNDIKDTLEIYDPTDPTKKVRIDAGSVSTGMTRVVTVPDYDLTIGNAPTSGTMSGTLASTTYDFTGIPSWVKEITISFRAASTNGLTDLLVQLGDSGGIEPTGYSGSSSRLTTVVVTTAFTTGIGIRKDNTGTTDAYNGSITITLMNAATFYWAWHGSLTDTTGNAVVVTSGFKALLGGVLDRIRITTVNGTDAYDGGNVNLLLK